MTEKRRVKAQGLLPLKMGRGDFPILLQQAFRGFVDSYNSSSLYHRNLGFFFLGIAGGSVWGARQRKQNEARNADCASVHITFYDLPPRADVRPDAPQRPKDGPPPLTLKRRFEKLWGDAARLLQRQPGYTYTLMFRKVVAAEDLDEATKQQTDTWQTPQTPTRKGVGAGIEDKTDKTDASNCQSAEKLLDYVEMRVWENEESHQKAQRQQMTFLQKMQELGVGMNAGRYRRVFDDALVRLIQ